MGIFNRIITAVSPTDSAALARAARDFRSATETGRAQRESAFQAAARFVYDGQQWDATEKLNREDGPSLVFNISEDYVDKYLGKLFPVNPRTQVLEIGVKTYEPDVSKRKAYETEILEVYKASRLSSILLEQGQNFLVGGSAVLYFPQDPTTKRATVRSIDPTRFAYLSDADGLLAASHSEDRYDDRGVLIQRLTYWTRASFVVVENDAVVAYGSNAFGFVPYAFIPNRPKPSGSNGRPKLASIRDLERDLNRRASDWSQRVGENTEPHLVVSSDKLKSADGVLKRGRKKITTLEKGGEASYLTVPDGEDIRAYVEFLRDMIKTKLSLVDSAGTIQSSVSGVSMAYQYSDMLDQVAYMRVYWDEAFRLVNDAILSYRFGLGGDYRTDPVYHPALPQDGKEKVEEIVLMVENELLSHRDAIEELRGGENADEKVAEILAERGKFGKVETAGGSSIID